MTNIKFINILEKIWKEKDPDLKKEFNIKSITKVYDGTYPAGAFVYHYKYNDSDEDNTTVLLIVDLKKDREGAYEVPMDIENCDEKVL
jgi:hypothetical protein